MHRKFRTVIALLGLVVGVSPALGLDIDSETARHVHANDPTTVLDPTAAPDSAWAEALEAGQDDRAVKLFVQRLREGPDRYDRSLSIPAMYERWLGRRIGHYGGHSLDADEVVDLHYEGVYGIAHTFKGAVDWHHDASAKLGDRQTHEWLWQLNRHYQWLSLADAYEKTGDPKYAEAWERELRSWIRQCPRPNGSGNEAGSAWRTIEAGIRAGWTWPYAFQTFRRSEHVSDEALWLFVCAMREHGIHLRDHPTGRNWLTMECDGLAHAGLMFPELKGARDFAAAAVRRAARETEKQFYPDGLQTELAPSYGVVAISNLYAVANLAKQKGYTLEGPDGENVVAPMFDRLVTATESLARLADPNGQLIPLHDSPPRDVAGMYDDIVLDARPNAPSKPWTRMKPDLLPWGGHAILRRNDGRYALLDAGPYGTGHQHADALQVLLFAEGQWLAIDPGKPTYDGAATSHHLRSAQAHNVVLMDRHRHGPKPVIRKAKGPLPIAFHTDGPVHAAAAKRTQAQRGKSGSFEHERLLLDLPSIGWLVVDRLTPRDEQAHRWEWLWQLPVDSEVEQGESSGRILGRGPGGVTLSAEARSTAEVAWEHAEGQREPRMRGWQSVGPSNTPTPAPVLQLVSEPTTGPVTAVTLLQPVSGDGDALSRLTDFQAAGEEIAITLRRGDRGAHIELVVEDGRVRTVRGTLPSGEPFELPLAEH